MLKHSFSVGSRAECLLRAIPVAALAALAGCGGGGSSNADSTSLGGSAAGASAPSAPVSTAATTLSGTVAVGAPMTSGRLRVLDATGAVVAADVAVAADGSYPAITLSGPAPYRIEACGYTGGNYQCIYSVAMAGGTANVTPLTSAMLLLASGQAPESLMTGAATGLSVTTLATAQESLRAGIAPLMASAGLSGPLDLVTGSLAAGSRTGYDRLLDSVGVSTGVDQQPFVQIAPRLGSGNFYLEVGGAAVGTLAATSSAAALPLNGLEALFGNMSQALRSAAACTDPSTGLAAQMSSAARLSMGGSGSLVGPAQLAEGLCGYFGGGGGEPSFWGARFVSPTLGRCDFTGANPICGVSFALQGPDGTVQSIADSMAVSFESGAWKFRGEMHPISLRASARLQRDRRIDGPSPVDSYMRALSFEIQAAPGLECARVAQRDSTGTLTTLAWFKRHPGDQTERLSAWRTESGSASRSLNPAVGFTRTADDTWLELPVGDAGDLAVRNFYRGGRTVVVSLFSNAGCSTAFTADGRSEFEVEVQGVPPLWSALAGLPWPELSTASKDALVALTAAGAGTATFNPSWTVPRSGISVGEVGLCTDRANCDNPGSAAYGKGRVGPSDRSSRLDLRIGSGGLTANAYKMLSLYGGTGDGIGVQSNYLSCPAVPAGQICSQ